MIDSFESIQLSYGNTQSGQVFGFALSLTREQFESLSCSLSNTFWHLESDRDKLLALAIKVAFNSQPQTIQRTHLQYLIAREEVGTTAVPAQVAFPHVYSSYSPDVYGVCIRFIDDGVYFGSREDESTRLAIFNVIPAIPKHGIQREESISMTEEEEARCFEVWRRTDGGRSRLYCIDNLLDLDDSALISAVLRCF